MKNNLSVFSISGYRATEIAKFLGVSRQAVSALAGRYSWDVVAVIGREKIYFESKVDEYLAARRRTSLLEKLGAKIRGLSWEDTPDGRCPICGGYAAYWNPDLEKYIADPSAKWACENNCENKK